MRLALHRAEEFNADFDRQYRWYLQKAGEDLAERFLEAVLDTCEHWPNNPIWNAAENSGTLRYMIFVHFE
jgi:hypothetical protein